jgi:hypothetical protein
LYHKEVKDARKALKSACQGKETIEQFNITFNSLLYSVDLSDASECKIYADAIWPKIVNLGLQRGGWTGVTNLSKQQAMTVKLANNVAEVITMEKSCAKGLTAWVKQRLVQAPSQISHPQLIQPQPKVSATPKLSEGTPMDINAISSSVGFSYPLSKRRVSKKVSVFVAAVIMIVSIKKALFVLKMKQIN